jgi:hypothetical protein
VLSIRPDDVYRTIKNVRTVEHPQHLMAGHRHRQIVPSRSLLGELL